MVQGARLELRTLDVHQVVQRLVCGFESHSHHTCHGSMHTFSSCIAEYILVGILLSVTEGLNDWRISIFTTLTIIPISTKHDNTRGTLTAWSLTIVAEEPEYAARFL